jgi:hypothetical protein
MLKKIAILTTMILLSACAESAPHQAQSKAVDQPESAGAQAPLQCYGEIVCQAGGRTFCADTQKCSRSGGRAVMRQ